MKKKVLVTIMIGLAMCGCGKVSKLKNGEDAVVKFEKLDSISVDSLYDSLKDRYAISLLIDMIDKEILFKEYKDKINDAEDYADEQVKNLKKNYDSEEELLNAINSYYGYSTLKEFKEYIELNYFRDLATTDYAKKQITDKEIESYYDSDIVGDIEASHILISVDVKSDATDEEKTKAQNKALDKAKEIIKKLDNGEDFATLAKDNSKDEATAKNGGSLGKVNSDDVVSEVFDALKSMSDGSYSKEPVKSTYGYHILYRKSQDKKPELDEKEKTTITEKIATEIADESSFYVKALKALREKNDMKIVDSDLEKSFEELMKQYESQYSSSN